MNEEKIFKALEQHKEHAAIFREELKVGLNTVANKIEALSEHQKVSNGRTGKLEEVVQKLREEDIGIGKELKFIKDNGRFIRDRTWTILTSVISILAVSVIMWVINR